MWSLAHEEEAETIDRALVCRAADRPCSWDELPQAVDALRHPSPQLDNECEYAASAMEGLIAWSASLMAV